jgi:hypothetical protein
VIPRGKINLVGVGILLVLVYVVWWAVTYGPARLDHFDVKEHVIAAFNQAKTDNMLNVRGALISKLNGKTLGWHMAEDESGNLVRKPGLGIKEEQMIIDRDEVNGTITVTVEYDRLVELKPFKKTEVKHFIASHTGPIH